MKQLSSIRDESTAYGRATLAGYAVPAKGPIGVGIGIGVEVAFGIRGKRGSAPPCLFQFYSDRDIDCDPDTDPDEFSQMPRCAGARLITVVDNYQELKRILV